jgi:hypothetical protein
LAVTESCRQSVQWHPDEPRNLKAGRNDAQMRGNRANRPTDETISPLY